MATKNQIDRRKPATDGPAAEEPLNETTNQAPDTIAIDRPAPMADAPIEFDEKTQTRFKVQIILTALQYWKLSAESANSNKDRCELVQGWIEPHLARVECGTQPKWVKAAMAKLAYLARKRAAGKKVA
jgi:hypothetical protein